MQSAHKIFVESKGLKKETNYSN